MILIAVFLVFAAAAFPARGDEENGALPGLASLVPEKTRVLIQFPSLKGAWEGFCALPPYRIYQDEEVQAFLQSLDLDSEELLPGADMKTMEKLLSLPDVFGGEIAFAVLPPDSDPEWVLSLSAVENPAGASTFAKNALIPLLEGIFQWGPEKVSICGKEVMLFKNPELTLCIFEGRGRILLTSSEETMEKLLGRAAGTDDTLATNETFINALEKCEGEDVSFRIYVSNESPWRDWLNLKSASDMIMFDASGLRGVRSFLASLSMAGGRADDLIRLDIPGEMRGFLNLFADASIDMQIARFAPEDTLVLLAGHLNIPEFYKTILAIRKANDIILVRGGAESAKEEIKDEMGMRAFFDMIPHLGTEAALFVSLPGGSGLWPEVSAVVEVLEPDQLQTNLFALVRTATGADPKTITFSNRRIHYYRLPDMDFLQVSLCWCVTDGYLFASYHPTVLKRLIRRIDADRDALENDQDFAKAWKKLPEGSRAVAYVNSRRLFNCLYGIMLPVMNMAGGDELPFDPAMLPTSEAVQAYLSFGLSGVTVEEDGIRVTTLSDGYGPTSMAMYGLCIASFFVPMEEWSDSLTRRPCCGDNQKHVHDELESYRRNHGRYPATLGELFDEGWFGSWAFSCPKARENRPASENDAATGEDFGYVVTAKEIDPPETFPDDWMIVWDSEPRHNNGRIVLLGEGEVTWLPEEAFQERLKEQGK